MIQMQLGSQTEHDIYCGCTECVRWKNAVFVDAGPDGQCEAQIHGKPVDPMSVICVAAALAGLLGLAIVFWM